MCLIFKLNLSAIYSGIRKHGSSSTKAIELGAQYYIVKPFDIELLIKRMREFKFYKNAVPNTNFITKEIKSLELKNIITHLIK